MKIRLLTIINLLAWTVIHSQSNIANMPKSDKSIEPFLIEVINSDYSRAHSISLVLTNKSLKIIFRGGLEGEKDSILLTKNILPSDTLKKISEINLDDLKAYYSNDCIQDGSQITIKFHKSGKMKTIHLSNYYQTDIGEIIYLVNALVPTKYKIWYDKERLLSEQEKCQH